MAKTANGLKKRGNMWHIDKHIGGRRICESTGTSDYREAERHLARRTEEIRQQTVYGVRPDRPFALAAARYLNDNGHKRSLERDARALVAVSTYINHLPLQHVHEGTLQTYVNDRRKAGISAGTIARDLAVVRRILKLAAGLWRDESGKTWLETAPLIPMPVGNKRKPYPLSWDEQARLFAALPAHLHRMALFAVNTGCRQAEVCGLRWDEEVRVPDLTMSVFVIPDGRVKNGQERVVVLNRVAASVIEAQRGQHPEWVFTYDGHRVDRINTHAWRRARTQTNLSQVRVHDLRHTFGRRLRAAGVSHEDRQDLLGHKNGNMTTHYSSAELGNLLRAVESIAETDSRKTYAVTLIRSAG